MNGKLGIVIIGADCILLILSCLSINQAKEFEEYATSLGLDIIVETHDIKEIELANQIQNYWNK